MAAPTVLIVPGLRDRVAEHWQTLLAAERPRVVEVPPMGREDLDLGKRLDAIDAALARIDGPAIAVAHSGGVIALVHWAQRGSRPLAGALLAAPPDFETQMPAGYPTMAALDAAGWLPVPRGPLPFPSIVAASSDDPLAAHDRALAMARDWGSEVVELGAVGHLNPASGFGPWPMAHALIDQLARRAAAAA